MAAAISLSLMGCQSGYVLKQAWRQLELSWADTPVESDDVAAVLSPLEREKLQWIPRVLSFAKDELGLEPSDAYRTYLDTQGQPLSYAVSAAHPLGLVAHHWCFPFAGCVPYKGFFDARDADREAGRLRSRGLEVEVSEVQAYSTLGWFSDPVLSSMLDLEFPELIELVLHEITHRTVYFPGRPALNESLASHVAEVGTQRFFARFGPELPAALERMHPQDAHAREAADLCGRRLQGDLEALYASSLADGEKLRRKAEVFHSAAAAWGTLGLPERSFPSNNVRVLARWTYRGLVPALRRHEQALGGHPRHLMAYLRQVQEGDEHLPDDLDELDELKEAKTSP